MRARLLPSPWLPSLLCGALLAASSARADVPPAPPKGAVEGEIVDVDGVLYEVSGGALVPFDDEAALGEAPPRDATDSPGDDAVAPGARAAPPDIDVTASRVDRGPSATVVTERVDQETVREVAARTLADVLERVPGASVTSSVGTGQEVSIDGLSAKHVLILIDGRPVNGRVNDRVDVSRLPISPSDVERVEIVRGPMSALYGSEALGGVVNIITRRPAPGVSADVEAGTLLIGGGAASTSLSGSGSAGLGDFLLRAHASLLAERGFDRAARDDDSGAVRAVPDGQLDRPHRRQASGSLELGWFLGDWLLSLDGGLAFNEIETRVSAAAPFRDHASDGQGFLAASAEGDIASGHSLDVDLKLDRYTHRYQKLPDGGARDIAPFCRPEGDAFRFFDAPCPATGNVRTDSTQDEARLEATWTGRLLEGAPFAEKLTASAGSVLRLEHVTRLNGDGEDTLPGGGDRYSAALYGEALWQPWAFLSLVSGLRLDGVTPGARDDVLAGALGPKLAARVALPFGLALRGSYGHGFRMPSFQERYLRFDHSDLGYIVEGNDALVPETSQGGRLGVSWTPYPRVAISSDAFVNVLQNLIAEEPVRLDEDTGVPVYVYRNVSRALTSGLNLQLSLVDLAGVSFRVGYQYLWSAVDASACPDETPYLCSKSEGATPLPLRPTHSGNASLRYRISATGTTLFTRADFMDERLLDDTDKAPGFVRLGAGFSQPITEHLEVNALLDNLLDSYDPVYGPKPGRAVALSIRGSL